MSSAERRSSPRRPWSRPYVRSLAAAGCSARSSACVWTSMKPGATTRFARRSRAAAGCRDGSDRGDPAVLDREVRPAGRPAGAIDHPCRRRSPCRTAEAPPGRRPSAWPPASQSVQRSEELTGCDSAESAVRVGASPAELGGRRPGRRTHRQAHDHDHENAQRVVPEVGDVRACADGTRRPATVTMPAIRPTNAPVPFARLNPSARTNTPSSEP